MFWLGRQRFSNNSASHSTGKRPGFTALGQTSRSVAVGLDYLRRHLRINWSPHPSDEEARREYEQIWSRLGIRSIEELIELPLMSDPASLATLDVLTKLVSAV